MQVNFKTFRKMYDDSLIKNSIYLMVTSFSTSILAFLFWVVAARYYSPGDIGIISAMLSSISLISMISSIGIPKALFFYLPRDLENASRMINSSIMTSVTISIIFSLIFIFGLKIWTPELRTILNNFENVIVFMVVAIVMTTYTLISAAFTAGRKSSYCMINDTIYHSSKIIPLIILASLGKIGIFLSICVGMILSTITGFFLLSKLWKYYPKLTFDPIIKNMMRFSFGNYVVDILCNIPKLIFPIMILNLISDKSAGYFYVAITMAGLLYGVSQSSSASLLVESSDEEKLWGNVNKAIKFNIILLVPGILLFIILGRLVLNIFSPIYAENSFNTLVILAVTSIPLSIVNMFTTIRNTQNRVMSIIKINLLVAVVTLILSIFLIYLGIEGVAISYLVGNIFGAMIVIYKMKNSMDYTTKLIKNSMDYTTKLIKRCRDIISV